MIWRLFLAYFSIIPQRPRFLFGKTLPIVIPSCTVKKQTSQSPLRRFQAAQPTIPHNDSTLRFGWRILLTCLILLGLALIGLWIGPNVSAHRQAAPASQNGTSPLVFAFYYTWFDESTWYSGTLSDQPVAPYASRERAIMGQHIEQAQRAGIDAFLVAWYGPGPNQTEPNLRALLEEAAARNFKIGILFETDAPTFNGIGDISAALQHAWSVHMQHPAYIRVGGRPVMFFWRPYIYNVGTWTSVRNSVDPARSQIWISEGVDVSYLATFDGHHLYSNTWNPPNDLNYTNQKFARWVQNQREKVGRPLYWVSTVMPGYDDVRIRPRVGYRTSREGGAYYERGWQAAINSNPDWIVVNSFNEWPEGTYIEPSVSYGDLFLSLTAKWSQQYTGRSAVVQPRTPAVASAPAVAAAPAALPLQSVVPQNAPTQNAPTQNAPPQIEALADNMVAVVDVALLNLRFEPNTSSSVAAQLAEGVQVKALATSGDWIQVDAPQATGWVYAPMVRLQSLAQQSPSSTIESSSNSTQSARSIEPTQPRATVTVASLNLRSQASTTSPVVRLLLEEMSLAIVGVGENEPDLDRVLAASGDFDKAQLNNAKWLRVEIDDVVGWVYSPMVQVQGDLALIQ